MLDEIKHLKIYHIFGIWNPHNFGHIILIYIFLNQYPGLFGKKDTGNYLGKNEYSS